MPVIAWPTVRALVLELGLCAALVALAVILLGVLSSQDRTRTAGTQR